MSKNKKPYPEMLRVISNRLGVPRNMMVMVGDTMNDQQMAKEAGVEFILFQSNARSAQVPAANRVSQWRELKLHLTDKLMPIERLA
jgi:phosphoglycolate phosphatase-like HAD superfamily hydrolase